MWAAIGAASGAMNLLAALQRGPTSAAGGTPSATDLFDTLSSGGTTAPTTPPVSGSSSQSGVLSPDTYAALLQAAQNGGANAPQGAKSPSDALKDLFSLIDGNGDGQISKAEFEAKLGAGGTNVAAADSVFAKLDTNGDGSVSLNELSSALKGAGHHGGHHHAHGAQGGGGAGGAQGAGGIASALNSALGGGDADGSGATGASQGATATTTTNSDGSVTTTITYANGSKVSSTMAANASASSNAASSYNFIEKMIQRQAKALAGSTAQGVSVTA